MLARCLLTIVFAGSVTASVTFAKELPPIPENAGIGVAAVSMTIAIVCDHHYKRAQMVRNSKALFLKFAKKHFSDPKAATERAFAHARRAVAQDASMKRTVEACDELDRMLTRELDR